MPDQEPNSALVYEMIAQHNEVIIEMKGMVADLIKEMRDQKNNHEDCKDKLNKAVPNGDYEGHRRYHEAVIERMEARAAIWKDVQKSVAKWGVIGLLTFMATALWHETIAKVVHAISK